MSDKSAQLPAAAVQVDERMQEERAKFEEERARFEMEKLKLEEDAKQAHDELDLAQGAGHQVSLQWPGGLHATEKTLPFRES